MDSVDDLYRWAHGHVRQALVDAGLVDDHGPSPGAPAGAGGASAVASRLTGTMLILRADGVIAFANAPLGAVAAEELVGTRLSSYLVPAQRALLEESVRAVFDGREPAECDLDWLLSESGSRSYEVRLAQLSRDGRVAAAAAVIRDITERRRRENALRRERDELKAQVEQLSARAGPPSSVSAQPSHEPSRLAALCTLFDAVGEAAFVTEAGTGKIVEVNGTACAWLKVVRERVIGQTGAALGLGFLLQDDDGSAAITETRGRPRPLVVGGGWHRRDDRTVFPVDVSLTRHVMDGRGYVLAVARMATAEAGAQLAARTNEQFYRALFECTRDAVLLVARSGEIRHANSAALSLFGYDLAGLTSMRVGDLLVGPDDVERFRAGVSRDGAVHALEVELRSRDGRRFPARLSATARRSDDNAPIQGYQCIIQPPSPGGAPVAEQETSSDRHRSSRIAVPPSAPRPAAPRRSGPGTHRSQ